MNAEPRAGSNPFPGLRAFEENEDLFFFGREGNIDDLLGRLRRSRFLAIVGSSGSGKSSLVRAGMLPALHGGFMAGKGSQWRIATLRPGSDPIGNLAEAMTTAAITPEVTGTENSDVYLGFAQAVLERGALGLAELVYQARLGDEENVLIVVDQFEELFRLQQQTPDVRIGIC